VALSPYKPNQGLYARGGVAAALLVLAFFASARLFLMVNMPQKFVLMGLRLSYGYVLAGPVFVVLLAFTGLFVLGWQTGLKALDTRTHLFIDLLADTQVELQKVSWPSREELMRSTGVVLLCIVVIGCLLFVLDQLVVLVLRQLQVLPP